MKKIIMKMIRSNKILSKFYAQLKLLIKKDQYKEIVQIMSQFYDKETMKNKKYVHNIVKDVFFCQLYYRILSIEYFIYKFNDLSDKKRKEFIGDEDRGEIVDKLAHISPEGKDILTDKFKCYVKFKDFYKRDIIKIDSFEDKSNFEEFCKKHSSFIVKPINLNQGQGIYIINQEDYKSLDDIWYKIKKDNAIILEELIEQTNDLGKFHQKSINTIRFATYIKNNVVTKLFAVFRMGQGDSVVDNASAGGIVANIDLETGIIISLGKNYKGKEYLKHPDSNVCIIGYQIPRWNELCEIVEKVARTMPEYNYISWDFALTEKGWTMVEGNARGGLKIYQIDGNGIRERYEKASN